MGSSCRVELCWGCVCLVVCWWIGLVCVYLGVGLWCCLRLCLGCCLCLLGSLIVIVSLFADLLYCVFICGY